MKKALWPYLIVAAVALSLALIFRSRNRPIPEREGRPAAIAGSAAAHAPAREATADHAVPPAAGRPVTVPDVAATAMEERALAGLPPGRLRDSLVRLAPADRRRALAKLVKLAPPRVDYASLVASAGGGLFYVCDFPPPPVAGAAASSASAVAGAAAAAGVSAASVPISTPPVRHSRPGSTNILYLDFNGFTIAGTAWNADAAAAYVAKPYDSDGDATTFSATEQVAIVEIWERVAEDYAAFDVDVTTEEPVVFTSTTAHALITSKTDANGVTLPYGSSSGGVAYVDAFGDADFAGIYSPALIYYDNLGTTRADYIAEATAHELGHNLGLSHDGQTLANGTGTAGSGYYTGHGGTTDVSWAPIMGAGYNRNLTQWSKGEYYLANNLQDDIAIIAAHTGFVPSETGGTLATATLLTASAGAVSATGILGGSSDADVYKVNTAAGTVGFSATTYRAASGTRGGDADIKLELLDATGSVIASADPADSPDATLTATVAAGTYYLRLTPAGTGDPLSSSPTGYTSYGSIGQYALGGTVATGAQTITFAAPADRTYGDAAFALVAAASSGLPVSFELVSGPATLSGTTLAITGAGTVTVRAVQPGNDVFSTASPVERSFTVSPAALTATAQDQTRNAGEANPPLTIVYTGFVNGDDASTLAVAPTATTSADLDSPAGTYPITLTGGSAANYTLTLVNGTLTVLAVNHAPTIGAIADQAIAENGTTGALAFAIGDAETAAGALTVTAASSNPTLVPESGLVLGGSDAERTITVTPAANQSGTATITLTVSDGALTASTSFMLTVNSVNYAPTVGAIADQTIDEDTATGVLTFIVGDRETAADALVVTAVSSNATLVPATGIALSGSGANRTIIVTPAANQSGSATITLTASDGALTASSSFVLTVKAVNDAPTISAIAAQSISEDAATAAIPFTVGDVETAAASLVVTRASSNTTLLPLAGIVLGGSGANRTVTLTPAANRNGTATVTLTVSDGALTASRSFTLTVKAVNDAPTITKPVDQVLAKNAASGSIAFSVGDVETAAASLVVTRASSSTTLLPLAGIVLGGSGANRTVKLTPAANKTGSATITLTVGDGTAKTSTRFTLTVQNPPTISKIASQTTKEDTATAAIAFTVGDSETAAAKLTVTAASSNTTLLPVANITLGGSGANRTVKLKPAANKNGTATVTLTVSDGTLKTSTSFTCTVTAVNDAPTISAIADQAINRGTATAALAFTISDAETAATKLTLTKASSNIALVPLTGIALGGSGANRTVTITPASGKTGTATITLTVSDGALTKSTSFAVRVNAPPTITKIANQTIATGGATTALAFTLADAETAAAKLTLTKTSSNTTLLPVASIVFGGSGANRTVKATPAKNRTGSVKITLTVSDGVGSASTAFWVTVKAATASAVVQAAATGDTGAAPVLTQEPGDAAAGAGSRLALSAAADAAGATFQWFKDGAALPGATQAELIVSSVALDDAGAYQVVATNAHGTTRSRVARIAVVEARSTAVALGTGRLRVETTIAVAGAPDTATFDLLLPAGWTHAGGAAAGATVSPKIGDTDLLEWIWTPSAAPLTLASLLRLPAGAARPEQLDGLVRVTWPGGTGEVLLATPLDR